MVAVVATVLAWPVSSVLAGPGLDSGYRYGLTAWATGRLGSRTVVYTSGPLGFLDVPQAWYRGPYLLEVSFALVVLGSLAWLTARRVSRIGGWPVALPLTWIVVATSFVSGAIEPAVLVGLLLAAEAWDGALSRRSVGWALAVAVPFLVLIKITSGGLVLFALLALLLSTGPSVVLRLQLAGTALASTVVGVVLIWLVLGRPIGQLDTYLHGVVDFSAGYDIASLELPGGEWEYVIAGIAAVAVLYLASRRTGSVRIAAVVLWAVVMYVDFKHGFIRHDAHSIAFFSAALVGCIAAPPVSATARWTDHRRAHPADRVATAIAAVVAACLCGTLIHLTAPIVSSVKRPWSAPRHLAHDVAVAVDNGRWAKTVAAGRAGIEQTLPVPAAMIERIGNRSVDLYPFQDGVIWAYHLHYAPPPVLQPYTAFTTWLDRLDQAAITGRQAPEFILSTARQAGIDGRYAPANSGGYQVEVQCRYHQVMADRIWTLLQRNPSGCGPRALLSRVTLRSGQYVAVPHVTGALIVAEITPHPGIGFALRKTVFKTVKIPQLVLDGRSYRLMWTAPGQPTPLSTVHTAANGTETITTLNDLAVDDVPGGTVVDFYAIPYQAATR